jgi:hypothetical protein
VKGAAVSRKILSSRKWPNEKNLDAQPLNDQMNPLMCG